LGGSTEILDCLARHPDRGDACDIRVETGLVVENADLDRPTAIFRMRGMRIQSCRKDEAEPHRGRTRPPFAHDHPPWFQDILVVSLCGQSIRPAGLRAIAGTRGAWRNCAASHAIISWAGGAPSSRILRRLPSARLAPEFLWGHLTQWAADDLDIQPLGRRPMPPLGHFSLIRFAR